LLCPTGSGDYASNADNELTAGPTGSYTYDAAGNQITSPQLSNLTYDSKNQNSSTTPSGGGAIASTYAGTGSADRTADGSTTLVSGTFGIDQSTTSGTTTYLIRNNTGTVIGEHVGSTSYYYLHDNVGSIVAIVNASGTVEDRDAYDPYGNLTSSSGTVANPLGYAGGYTDSTTGLIKFGARYYNPGIGSFTQEDPSGQTAGYTYAGGDPVNGADPSGESACSFLPVGCGTISNVVSCVGGYLSGAYTSASQALIASGAAAGAVGGAVLEAAGEIILGAVGAYVLLAVAVGLVAAGLYEGVTGGC
jgi:RHS repeat-associated protein